MAYNAATTESVLLKYLQLRSRGDGSESVAVSELLEDLHRLQTADARVQVYSSNGQNDGIEPAVVADLDYLKEQGLVCFTATNVNVRLSEWGRFYAELFDLPPTVAQGIKTIVHGRVQARTGA